MPRTKGLKDYPSELKEKILKEREAGLSLRQIARKYNVSVYSVGALNGGLLFSMRRQSEE